MPIRPEQRTQETFRIESLIRDAFPQAQVDAYRHNSASIRVRVVDPSFAGTSRIDREERVLPVLQSLSDEIVGDITVLLLLAPGEQARSMMNLEFEDPVPSGL